MAERCFIMLKPGVLNRRLAGEVISRLERKGLNLVAAKLMRISPELAKNHYKEHEDKCFYSNLVDYISSAPVLAMVWEADNCVALVRRLVGATDVMQAAPGTIRGDFCLHTPLNIIHASDSPENGERETALFFKPEEIVSWQDDYTGKYI
ncbi:nucleoside-diphosphate kinase [Treponema lecithinolyticum]|mgnify:CR=1 FL=1|uniref:Nucleoside diphosphate kinase n=1 Tax=Treponema lecithinolyticum ATCC 700332 TaxID=1321815 RepID=A0ABN0NYA3_TRELE|nr:nucleoside-diphosphate kinase [Treponema lecithinolyticum]ERJ92650.1 nucleoside diphosphate kinase [Treponema lecithinolyticum ATCC 700332]